VYTYFIYYMLSVILDAILCMVHFLIGWTAATYLTAFYSLFYYSGYISQQKVYAAIFSKFTVSTLIHY